MLTMPSRKAFRRLALRCLFGQVSPPPFELIVALDEGDHLAFDDATILVDSGIPRQVITGTWATVADKQNAAIALARGTWVTLWDDDDWSSPDRLADTAAAIARAPGAGIVGPPSIFYHELIGKDRRTLQFTTGVHVVDGCSTFKRALWEANPFPVKSKFGDVGDWIVRRVRAGTTYEPTSFTYVAMVHGKNATMPARPFRVDPKTGVVHDGPNDYKVIGDRTTVLGWLDTTTLAAYEAAAAAAPQR